MEIKHLPIYTADRIDLAQCDEIWAGWYVHSRELVSREGWRFRPSEILTLPLLRLRIDALELEAKRRYQAAPAYSVRLAQLHTMRAAVAELVGQIAQEGTTDELHELRDLRNLP